MLSRLNSLAGQGASGSSSPATRSERLTAICTLATFLSYINFTSGSSGDCLAIAVIEYCIPRRRHQSCSLGFIDDGGSSGDVTLADFFARRLHHSGSLKGAWCVQL